MYDKFSLMHKKEIYLLSFLFVWFVIFASSFIAPNTLDSWNLINNVLRFETFSSYFDTTGVGFSMEMLLYIFSIPFGVGIGFIILSLLFFFLFCFLVFNISFLYKRNITNSYLILILSIPVSIPQIGGFYWDHAGLYLGVLLLYLVHNQTKDFRLRNIFFISIVCSIMFFSKQNSGLIYFIGIFCAALVSGKRISYKDFGLIILLTISLGSLIHLFSFNNLNILETTYFHIKTMFLYVQDNPLDKGRLDLNLDLFLLKLFPAFNKHYYTNFYPLASPYIFLISLINFFIIFQSIKSLIEKNRSDLFLYIGLIALHYSSVLLWGRNWTYTQSLLPLIFYLSIDKELSIKNILPIILISLIFCFIFFRGIFYSYSENTPSPLKPLMYSYEAKKQMEYNLASKINFNNLQEYISHMAPDCIFTIGTSANPLMSFGKEVCTNRVQIDQSRAVLRESFESSTKSFLSSVNNSKNIMTIDSCFREESICREKNDLVFYENLVRVYSSNLANEKALEGFKIYHNIKKKEKYNLPQDIKTFEK